MRHVLVVIAVLYLACSSQDAAARGGGGHGGGHSSSYGSHSHSSSSGTVHVNGYFRKDGTYVQPHTRTAPDGIQSNNLSYHEGTAASSSPPTEHRSTIHTWEDEKGVHATNDPAHMPTPVVATESKPEHSPSPKVADPPQPLKSSGEAKATTSTTSTKPSYSSRIKKYRSEKSQLAKRDANGRIKRSAAARRKFMKATGYPNGRPGYVVDHIVPLKRGGKDDPSNMQWQTKADAKAKDKWE